MISRIVFLLGGLLYVHCQLDDSVMQVQQQGGFRPLGGASLTNMFAINQNQKMGASMGSAAAAGQALTQGGFGQASSINQANQMGTKDMTQASGISANTAMGNGATAGGAAQAAGTVNSAEQNMNRVGQQGQFVMPGK